MTSSIRFSADHVTAALRSKDGKRITFGGFQDQVDDEYTTLFKIKASLLYCCCEALYE
jgi:hypothetical protein